MSKAICKYLSSVYSDDKLAALLAHAEDGKLAFHSCCCFAGVPSATHALLGETSDYNILSMDGHDDDIDDRVPWFEMSDAFWSLASTDTQRRAAIIPLIHAEMARREAERNSQVSKPALAQVV